VITKAFLNRTGTLCAKDCSSQSHADDCREENRNVRNCQERTEIDYFGKMRYNLGGYLGGNDSAPAYPGIDKNRSSGGPDTSETSCMDVRIKAQLSAHSRVFLAYVFMLITVFLLTRYRSRITVVANYDMAPMIVAFTLVGAFVPRNFMADLTIAVVFGIPRSSFQQLLSPLSSSTGFEIQ
jgi:hypothetical protein